MLNSKVRKILNDQFGLALAQLRCCQKQNTFFELMIYQLFFVPLILFREASGQKVRKLTKDKKKM
jgi:hypothetical protein